MIEVEVQYEAGHRYRFSYDYCPGVFCLNCGVAEVYSEQSEGDYYVGPTCVCVRCGATFTFQGGVPATDWDMVQVIRQLRDARGIS